MALPQEETEVRVPELTLGDRLRLSREKAGLEQKDMAVIFETTPGAIGHWERDRSRPRALVDTTEKWAEVTHVPHSWLLLGKSSSGYKPGFALSVVPGGVDDTSEHGEQGVLALDRNLAAL